MGGVPSREPPAGLLGTLYGGQDAVSSGPGCSFQRFSPDLEATFGQKVPKSVLWGSQGAPHPLKSMKNQSKIYVFKRSLNSFLGVLWPHFCLHLNSLWRSGVSQRWSRASPRVSKELPNLGQLEKKGSLRPTWGSLGCQNLPRVAPGAQKQLKTIKNM